jgi:hypothetical protein
MFAISLVLVTMCFAGCKSSVPAIPDAPREGLYTFRTTDPAPDRSVEVTVLGVRSTKGGAYLDLAIRGTDAELVARSIAGQFLLHGATSFILARQFDATVQFTLPKYDASEYLPGFHVAPVQVNDFALAPPRNVTVVNGDDVVFQPVILATATPIAKGTMDLSFTDRFADILTQADTRDIRSIAIRYDHSPLRVEVQ